MKQEANLLQRLVAHRSTAINYPKEMHNFPTQPTTFIGRSEEIYEIGRLIQDPACRLLTLSAPGGMGKTRLAIESAKITAGQFALGAYFIPLQSVTGVEHLVQAIADTMKLFFSGTGYPLDQLLAYLEDKEILLVLDNFEQLLPHPGTEENTDVTVILSEILQFAPGVKLLVTSREVLNIRQEWVYSIEGMVYPPSIEVENLGAYSAVQLFIDRARRIRKGVSLVKDQEHIVRICQLVEGMPLALELSAAWINTLSCAEIAAELQKGLDLLATSLRDIPDRHQSMQAVFSQSWKLLTRAEQETFKRLTIFHGGFKRSAGEHVAGASLPILSALVDKSLLRRDAGGRYHVHELLRQFGEEQLLQSPSEIEQAHNSHNGYYVDFLINKQQEIDAGSQRAATVEIETEIENVRVVWDRIVKNRDVETIHKVLGPLLYFYQFQSRYLEGATAFAEAIRSLEELPLGKLRDLTIAELSVYHGWLCIRLGQLETAKQVLERSLELHNRVGSPYAHRMGTDPRTALGILAAIYGDYGAAARLGKEAYQVNLIRANAWNQIFALYVLTSSSFGIGELKEARQYALQSYELTKEVNDQWFRAFVLNDLGRIAFVLGEYTDAQGYFLASHNIRKDFDDPGGMAEALNHLGKIAVISESFDEAGKLFEESLSMYREVNDKGGAAAALDGLGLVAYAQGDYPSAAARFWAAAKIALEIQYQPQIISVAIHVGELWLHTNQAERSFELASAILADPACGSEARSRARVLLTRCQAEISPKEAIAAEERANVRGAEETLRILLKESPIDLHKPGKGAVEQPSAQELIDPLTDRELEVLRLIAEGRSNKEIAETLFLTLGTVKWYNNQIFSKLNVTNRIRAVARANELDLFH